MTGTRPGGRRRAALSPLRRRVFRTVTSRPAGDEIAAEPPKIGQNFLLGFLPACISSCDRQSNQGSQDGMEKREGLTCKHHRTPKREERPAARLLTRGNARSSGSRKVGLGITVVPDKRRFFFRRFPIGCGWYSVSPDDRGRESRTPSKAVGGNGTHRPRRLRFGWRLIH
jgi:hypothetical protein